MFLSREAITAVSHPAGVGGGREGGGGPGGVKAKDGQQGTRALLEERRGESRGKYNCWRVRRLHSGLKEKKTG